MVRTGAAEFCFWTLFCTSGVPPASCPSPGHAVRQGWHCQRDINGTAQAPSTCAGSGASSGCSRRSLWAGQGAAGSSACLGAGGDGRSPLPSASRLHRHPEPAIILQKRTACHNSLLNAKLPIINKHGPNNSSPDLTHCRKQPQK